MGGIGTLVTIWFKGIKDRKEQKDKLEIAMLKLNAQEQIAKLAVQATEQIMAGKSSEEKKNFALALTQSISADIGIPTVTNGSQISLNEAKVFTDTPRKE